METGPDLLKTYEELIEWRKKAQAMKKFRDEPSTLLREIHNLANSISTGLKDVNTTEKHICHETNDIKFQFESDNYLRIGRESVRPLVELKTIATDMFNDIGESDANYNVFTEVMFTLVHSPPPAAPPLSALSSPDLTSCQRSLFSSQLSNRFSTMHIPLSVGKPEDRVCALYKGYILNEDIDYGPAYKRLEKIRKFANMSKEFIKHLNSTAEGITVLENESEKSAKSESTFSITGSDPSTSEFSLFINSETNMATSSPISKSLNV